MFKYMLQLDDQSSDSEPRWEYHFNMVSDNVARSYTAAITAKSKLSGPFRLWRMDTNGEAEYLVASYYLLQQQVVQESI